MTINLLHISDTHFGSENFSYSSREIKSALANLIKELDDENLFVLISGDITFQGNKDGYKESTIFFESLIEECKLKRNNILLCPGNHDIVKTVGTQYFYSFDAFSYSLRRDKRMTYSGNNNIFYEASEVYFLGINSAFKLDHRYGYVDIDSIVKRIKESGLPKNKCKIAFLHHHLINQFEFDLSVLRNAYELLTILDEYHFKYVFHGHQHSNQYMPIGESKLRVFGVRTFSYGMKGGVNGLNHYMINENSILVNNYIYLSDQKTLGGESIFCKQNSRVI